MHQTRSHRPASRDESEASVICNVLCTQGEWREEEEPYDWYMSVFASHCPLLDDQSLNARKNEERNEGLNAEENKTKKLTVQ